MKLAQLNIAKAKYPLDAPEIKEFVDNLDVVNAMAESSEGFIWRLKDESGDVTSIQAFADPLIIVNMSVWTTVDALKDFIFRMHHRDFMRKKGEWFHRLLEDEHIPTLEEAKDRLDHLRNKGETPYAFSFRGIFPASQ